MNTAVIKFDGDGIHEPLTNPRVEGHFDFAINPLTTYDPVYLVPTKAITFAWCPELQQDLYALNKMKREGQPMTEEIQNVLVKQELYLEMLAQRLKEDFIDFVRKQVNIPSVDTAIPRPMMPTLIPDGHKAVLVVERTEGKEWEFEGHAQVINLDDIGTVYEWLDESKGLVRKKDPSFNAVTHVMELLDDLCVVERTTYVTDAWLADMITKILKWVPYDTEINHVGINSIIERRVKEYCTTNSIEVSEYKGVLPYRVFKVKVGGE